MNVNYELGIWNKILVVNHYINVSSFLLKVIIQDI